MAKETIRPEFLNKLRVVTNGQKFIIQKHVTRWFFGWYTKWVMMGGDGTEEDMMWYEPIMHATKARAMKMPMMKAIAPAIIVDQVPACVAVWAAVSPACVAACVACAPACSAACTASCCLSW